MQVHIGKKIEERMRELRFSPTYLAKKVNTSRQNIYGIFKRKSIDTDLLKKISEVLEFDFFSLYRIKASDKEKIKTETEDIRSEIEKIHEELEQVWLYLKKLSSKKKK